MQPLFLKSILYMGGVLLDEEYVEKQMIKEYITSDTNQKIKLAASLHKKKYRDHEALFIVEGIRLVETAVQAADWQPEFCLCIPELEKQVRTQRILANLAERKCPIYGIAEGLYKKVSNTIEAQGILLVMRKKNLPLADLRAGKAVPFWVILDGIQDPGNAGTIIRSADAAGCNGIILTRTSVDVFSDKVVRSTMGSIFHLPIIQGVSHEDLLTFCKQEKVALLAAALDREAKHHFCLDYTKPCALVFGNEGNGISPELLQAAEEKLYIPMVGKAESLNVAMAASIVIYEAMRQRMMAQSSFPI